MRDPRVSPADAAGSQPWAGKRARSVLAAAFQPGARPMSLEELVSTYGYLAVLIGTFLEGETILVIAGFLCHREYLQLPGVIAAAFIGTVAGDQLFFHLGRRSGLQGLAARPRWMPRAMRVRRLIVRHQIWLILGFRFLYGLRTITPFMLGASHIRPMRFLAFNVVGAFVWACAFGSLGYALGQTLHAMLADIKRYELIVAVLLVCVLLTALLMRWRRSVKGERSEASPGTRR